MSHVRSLLRWHADCALFGAVVEGEGLVRLALATPTLPPATTTNHYIVGFEAAVLVDPSAIDPRDQRKLLNLIEAFTQAGGRLVALFLTHHHNDHSGAAQVLRQATGLPVWAHPTTERLLSGRIAIDALIADGQTVARNADGSPWLAVFTPGHAPGHLVLHHAASGQIVAGDMVAGVGTILIEPVDGDMAQYLHSLALLEALNPTSLAPAHGEVQREPIALLRHYQAHRRAREAKIAESLSAQWGLPMDMLPTAYGDVSRLAWPLALLSMQSHLLHLQAQGIAVRDGDRWRRAA